MRFGNYVLFLNADEIAKGESIDIYKRALEILSIFTEAAQIAKAKNKVEYKLEMDETTLAGLLKKTLPFITDDKKALSLASKYQEPKTNLTIHQEKVKKPKQTIRHTKEANQT